MEPTIDNAHSVNKLEATDDSHKSTRFRFKRKHQESSNRARHEDKNSDNRHRHRRHHRSKRHKTSQPVDDASTYDDSASGLPPDAAFRESLFDAMGDDEGAAFWQGVYGQPIHTFPNTYQNESTGELEQMTDEEYAQFVRRKMWEKSWEGIEAAKEEKRQEREQEKQRMRDDDRAGRCRKTPQSGPDYLFDLDIEQSLYRGERRRSRKRWKELWEDYLQRWQDLESLREARKTSDNSEHLFLRNKIAWPIESGKRKDVASEEIERFVRQCAEAIESDDETLSTLIKTERVRWHPDKIQQRYGFMEIDDNTMSGVTAVFQVFDRMWNERRGKT